MAKVTPWDVSGRVDYDKLIADFGVSKLSDSLLARLNKMGGSHFLLDRKVFFAHRDLKWILDEYEKGNKFYLYTGRAPSGPVHLGHLLPWIFCKWLQDTFDVELWFQFPDEEKFLFKKELDFEDTQGFLEENMLDVAAIGFDPKKTFFLIDTVHAGLMYKEACKVAKKLTLNNVKSTFGLTDSSNVGQAFYTSMQAVPAFLPSVLAGKNRPCLIPHAIDQDPHFRLTRDILPRLGFDKPASLQCVFLPPLGGVEGKMSSSEASSAILTTDDAKTVKKKINKYAFSGGRDTLEEHRAKGGNPDVDISFQYLRMLFMEDDDELLKIYNSYKSGELLSGELKAILIDKVNEFLAEHQKRREKVKGKLDQFIYKP